MSSSTYHQRNPIWILFYLLSFCTHFAVTIPARYTSNPLQDNDNGDDDVETSTSTSVDKTLIQEIAKLKEPDFVLIGVVKSGSTSLYHYMVQHPQISGVEQEFLLPSDVRDHLQHIIQLRARGKIPKVAASAKTKTTKLSKTALDHGQPAKAAAQLAVKDSVFEINNFDLSRMLKPIIDQKEVRFFDSFWYNHLQTVANHSMLTAWKWYLDVFNQDAHASSDLIRGEASPTYFASSQFTAQRIQTWLPDTKLILLLRNPVRRLVSHLKMIKENHADNLRFRKMRQIEQRQKRMNATTTTSVEQRRRLQYNNPLNNMPYTMPGSGTRYGGRKRKTSGANPLTRLMRTNREHTNSHMRQQFTHLLDEYEDLLQQQQGVRDNWIDGDMPLSLSENDVMPMNVDDAQYINEEIAMHERLRPPQGPQGLRPQQRQQQQQSRPRRNHKDPKRPVNKMEEIIGAIYKLSMYQVILVSNANPASSKYYIERWGIQRDVSSFINRLLFGGIYAQRMKEWTSRFDDQHFFYRDSDALFHSPVQLMRELETFLGVPHWGDAHWQNVTRKVYNVQLEKGKGYQHDAKDAQDIAHWDISVDKETKIPHPTEARNWRSLEIIELLRDYYRPRNLELAKFLGGVRYKDWDY